MRSLDESERQLDPTLLAGAATAREQERTPVEGTALCLSGGGYRAMVFHLGALWRLNDLGMLRGLARVSSVSGGSITAGVLGSRWRELDFDRATSVGRAFAEKVAGPIHELASTTIDIGAVVTGALLPGTRISDRIESAYRKHLFGDRTLQDLPSDDEGPRFVVNATSLQTGAVFRFSRPYMADYHVGKFLAPKVALAKAVAASSAFPPFLSPVVLPLSGERYEDGSGDAAYADYRREAVLSDGGVYDNLGLETAWKRFKTVLVSDGGAALKVEIHPAVDWALGAIRVLGIIDNQVRALRTRMTVDAFRSGVRQGTYFAGRGEAGEAALSERDLKEVGRCNDRTRSRESRRPSGGRSRSSRPIRSWAGPSAIARASTSPTRTCSLARSDRAWRSSITTARATASTSRWT